MSAYYFDSSALVKRYATETGTNWVAAITAPSSENIILMALVTGAEVVAAIGRKIREGSGLTSLYICLQ